MIHFSIIIPIYNVEKYIGKAFESIYSQGLSDDVFEVIAVNDGTSDNSMQIVEQYAGLHENIVIINQENAGVSVARNQGMRLAKGEYIVFLDPDDWFANGAFTALEKAIKEHPNADIILFQSYKNNHELFSFEHLIKEKNIFSSTELFFRNFLRCSWSGGAYKQFFLKQNEIIFPEDVENAEDTIFFTLCLACNANIIFIPYPFYIIFARKDSASRHKFSANELVTKYSQALHAAMRETKQRHSITPIGFSILEYLRYIIIHDMVWFALTLKLSLNMKHFHSLKNYLPIKMNNIPADNFKIALLNFSPLIYYYHIKFCKKIKFRQYIKKLHKVF